ncbi:MAG: type II toxin-antitoxin system HicA family toxin [Angelakisella sp.]|jgi:predicted RNA binding protein YcfA (HicA-like mRNA interferase family)|nr:type II toxin-antitoxin system HicA family toxin [Angelakisella sp.]
MNPRKETVSILVENGFFLARHGSNHDIYFHPERKITIPVKRHNFDEDDRRYILREAKIDQKQQGKRKSRK